MGGYIGSQTSVALYDSYTKKESDTLDLISYRIITKRAMEEAGLTLVDGSFESGAVVYNTSEVVLQELTGKTYGWGRTIPVGGYIVPAGSTPATTGGIGAGAWIDRTDVTLRSDLLTGDGSNISYRRDLSAAIRSILSKFYETPSVDDYLLTTLENAIALMATQVGFIRFAIGNYQILDNITISVPVHFEDGAYITVSSGVTVTMASRVTSSRQHIFKGDGLVSFTGEEARQAHVSWFGSFPTDIVAGVDQSPFLQKCTNAMGNTRESLIYFDVGTYPLDNPVIWNRASKVHGMGDRLTNIWVRFLSGDVFKTNGGGVNFHDLQFNVTAGPRTSGAFILLQNERCEAYDIYMDSGYIGVDIASGAYECEVHRIKGLSWSTAAGSRVVRAGADDATVKTVNYTSSTPSGPEYVVTAEAVTSSVNRIKIQDVSARTNQSIVGVYSKSAFTVNETTVDDIRGRAGNRAVKVLNTGSSGMNVVHVNNVIAGSEMTCAVSVENTSTGGISGVMMDEVTANSVSGNGVEVLRNGSGTLSVVTLGQHDLRGNKGLIVGGTNIPISISIGCGFARNCASNGYDITATHITAHGINARSNSGIGILINLGSNTIDIDGISAGNGTNLTDNSGAVTKDVNVLVS